MNFKNWRRRAGDEGWWVGVCVAYTRGEQKLVSENYAYVKNKVSSCAKYTATTWQNSIEKVA